MKLTFVGKAYKEFRPRLPGALLVTLIHCVPIYAFTWYFSLIDDLSARISISLLVTIEVERGAILACAILCARIAACS